MDPRLHPPRTDRLDLNLLSFCYALAVWYGAKLIIDRGYNGGTVLTVIFVVLTGAILLLQRFARSFLNAYARMSLLWLRLNRTYGNRIAAPRLLKLSPLDSHRAGAFNKFRGAQFSWVTEDGKQEHHLVATVGKFSVIWNFQQVKDGPHECYKNQVGLKSCYCYKIVPKDDSIVDSRFMHEKFAVSYSAGMPASVSGHTKAVNAIQWSKTHRKFCVCNQIKFFY